VFNVLWSHGAAVEAPRSVMSEQPPSWPEDRGTALVSTGGRESGARSTPFQAVWVSTNRGGQKGIPLSCWKDLVFRMIQC
jgi:hypothetical protein